MNKLESYAEGHWVSGSEGGAVLTHAITGKPVAAIDSTGLDVAGMLDYARSVGGPALRRLTFHQRALMVKALAKYLDEHKAVLYELSGATGATRRDSWPDIDGGISTAFVFSSKGRRELPNSYTYLDGMPERVSREGTFLGQHVFSPLRGAAIHINAFNFPCWGMLEKLAPSLIAGVPAIIKPASTSAFLAERLFRLIIESGVLPEGAVQLICGSVGDLFDHLSCQDVVAFTGSQQTATMLKAHSVVMSQSVRFNAEADSLNAATLGPDAGPGTPEFDLFVKELATEMTNKAGQKCTAIRRAIVPERWLEAVSEAAGSALSDIPIGNPESKVVRMGALASPGQREEVRARSRELLTGASIAWGTLDDPVVVDADAARGAFVSPLLLKTEDTSAGAPVNNIEAFGPVASLVGYRDPEQAAMFANAGDGSLVSTVCTADPGFASFMIAETGPFHGRIHVLDRHCAKESTGHGSPLAHLVHGGPGRAGGGEEMGGIRGVLHYMQRTAVQGSPDVLTAAGGTWVTGANEAIPGDHPFRKTFHELIVGDTLKTGVREVTLEDIERFAAHTGDTFCAHMDENSAKKNPFFGGRVAHGYLLISFAAGLFVDPDFGPVLANYGIDNLRFTKPVYPGDSIQVRLTCKRKTLREGSGYGEVAWDTEIRNQDDEIVAAYDVLTMVAESMS